MLIRYAKAPDDKNAFTVQIKWIDSYTSRTAPRSRVHSLEAKAYLDEATLKEMGYHQLSREEVILRCMALERLLHKLDAECNIIPKKHQR